MELLLRYKFQKLCFVMSFKRHMCRVVSYQYDTTHLDSLVSNRQGNIFDLSKCQEKQQQMTFGNSE